MSSLRCLKRFKTHLKHFGKLTERHVVTIWQNKIEWLTDLWPPFLCIILFKALLLYLPETPLQIEEKNFDQFVPVEGLMNALKRHNQVSFYPPKGHKDLIAAMFNITDGQIAFWVEETIQDFNSRLDHLSGQQLCGIRIFKKKPVIDIKYHPDLRITTFPDHLTWDTSLTERLMENILADEKESFEEGAHPYYREGFLGIIDTLAKGLMVKAGNFDFENATIKMRPFPLNHYYYNGFYKQIFDNFPLIIIVSMQASCTTFVRFLMHSRETGFMERLLTKGVNQICLNLSYMAYGVIYSMGIFLIFIIGTQYSVVNLTLLPQTDIMLFLILLFLSMISQISLNGMLMAIYKKGSTVIVIDVLYLWFTLIPYIIVLRGGTNSFYLVYIMVTFCPNTAIACGIKICLILESLHTGLTWSNVNFTISPKMNCTFLYIVICLIIHCVGYTVAWFLVEHYSWQKFVNLSRSTQIQLDAMTRGYQNMALLVAKDLTKKYGKLVAIQNVSLTLYEGEVTVVMGHIGCGKSTLLRLLARLSRVSQGDILVRQEYKNSIGYTKQLSRYASKFTVRSELAFYCSMGGSRYEYIEQYVNEIVDLMDLLKYQYVPFDNLPSGYKKRANLAMAFVGAPKLIFLDHPNDGLDAAGLECLKKTISYYRTSSSIVIGASDFVAFENIVDRVIILQEGSIKVSGSLEQLSEKFRSGFYLSVVRADETQSADYVMDALKEVVPNVELSMDVGFLLGFSLPIYTDIDAVKRRLSKLRLVQYDINQADIQKIYRSALKKDFPLQKFQKLVDFSQFPRYTGTDYTVNTIYASFLKHFYVLKRGWILICLSLGCFSLIVILSLIRYISTPALLEPFELSFEPYHVPVVLIATDGSADGQKRYERMKDYLEVKNIKFHENNIEGLHKQYREFFKKSLDYRIVCAYLFQANKNDEILFNLNLHHTSVVALTQYYQPFLQQENIKYEFRNYPFGKETWEFLLLDERSSFLLDISSALMLPIALFFTFVLLYCFNECSIKFKDVQIVGGVSWMVYWGCTFCVMFLFYLVSAFFIITPVFFIVYHYTGGSYLNLLLILITVIYGVYLIFDAFNKTLTTKDAYTEVQSISLGYMLGSVLSIKVMSGLVEKLPLIGFLIQLYSQSFNFHAMFIEMITTRMTEAYCQEMIERCMSLPHDTRYHKELEAMCQKHVAVTKDPCNPELEKKVFSVSIPRGIAIMVFSIIVKMGQLYVHEEIKTFIRSRIPKFTESEREHEDVKNEKRKIRSYRHVHMKIPRLFLKDLTLIKDNHRLLNGICLEINDQQTVALLGTNNSNALTIFKILTQQINMTQGIVYINGKNLEDSSSKQCNNFSSNHDVSAFGMPMRTKEFLRVMAMIRGFSFKDSEIVALELAEYFEYDQYMESLMINLCCGYLKKISNSLLFLGMYPLLLVKNPTLDLDIYGKWQIYIVLTLARKRGQSILLRSYVNLVALTLSTHVALVSEGEITRYNRPENLLKPYRRGFFLYIHTRAKIRNWQIERLLRHLPLAFEILFNIEHVHVIYIEKVTFDRLVDIVESLKAPLNNLIKEYRIRMPSVYEMFYHECIKVTT